MPHERSTVFACVSTDTADAAREDVLHEVQLVYRTKPIPMLPAIQKAFETVGWLTTTSKLANCRKNVAYLVVMVAYLEGLILSTLHNGAVAAIQAISTTASSLLWVTKGGLLTDKKPGLAMAAGSTPSQSRFAAMDRLDDRSRVQELGFPGICDGCTVSAAAGADVDDGQVLGASLRESGDQDRGKFERDLA
ncbi:MAG: hypothetical protein LQ341_005461 [Variospora aurantia]|nr:MAG: hypothetical protein LQ341_005461 [Variospora aurantia]